MSRDHGAQNLVKRGHLFLAIRTMARMRTTNGVHQNFHGQTRPAVSAEFGSNFGESVAEKVDFAGESENTSCATRCNVGHTEQKIRIGAGTALLAAAAFAPLSRGWRIGLAVAGASQLVTGALSYCPLWQALGINTRREGED